MYTIITLTDLGYSTHVLFELEAATRTFNAAIAAPAGVTLAVFLYGPEGHINDWNKDR